MRSWYLLLPLAGLAFAQQQNIPHIGYVYPAGGRQGTTFEVTVGGQYLTGASEAYISGSGVQATVEKYIRPLTPGQANTLREQMQELVQRQTAGEKLIRSGTENHRRHPRQADGLSPPPLQPGHPETVILKVMVARDAAARRARTAHRRRRRTHQPDGAVHRQLPEFTRPTAKVPPAFNVVNGATPPPRLITAQKSEPPTA